MTNAEWIKTLPVEELARKLNCSCCENKNEDSCVGLDCNYYKMKYLLERKD